MLSSHVLGLLCYLHHAEAILLSPTMIWPAVRPSKPASSAFNSPPFSDARVRHHTTHWTTLLGLTLQGSHLLVAVFFSLQSLWLAHFYPSSRLESRHGSALATPSNTDDKRCRGWDMAVEPCRPFNFLTLDPTRTPMNSSSVVLRTPKVASHGVRSPKKLGPSYHWDNLHAGLAWMRPCLAPPWLD